MTDCALRRITAPEQVTAPRQYLHGIKTRADGLRGWSLLYSAVGKPSQLFWEDECCGRGGKAEIDWANDIVLELPVT